jgi:DNA-binding beta-propeller fold protein YncE
MPRGVATAFACLLSVALLAPAASADFSEPPRDRGTREVLYVGNNWDGTAHVVDPRKFKTLDRINIVPDLEERLQEIVADPVGLPLFLGIRALIGEGNDQYVDDMFSSPDGRKLFVSRPSLADVVAIDLRTGKIDWRFEVAGSRADHMAISPDGRKVLVSASTGGVVHEVDTRTGKQSGQFNSGDQPHESNYSKDGKRIYHASIGSVFTPTDQPALDGTKGDRVFQIVDAKTLEVKRQIVMGPKMAEFGRPGMSSAVRPMTIAPGDRFLYFQLSFFHGFVEYDLKRDRVTRVADLPLSENAQSLPRELYLLDSAHHGLTMNPEGTRLCVAGTMSDYGAIVSRKNFENYRIAARGRKPYWSTNDGTGKYCFISFSGDDRVGVISYKKRREIASIDVGDHPQRMRMGAIRPGFIGASRD